MTGLRLAGHRLRLDGPRRRVLAGVLPATFAVTLHSTVLDLPNADVIDAIDADRYRIYWVVGAFLVGSATGMVTTGLWQGRFGLRRTFVASVALFAVAAALCASAADVESMAPWRLVSGYGAGLVLCAGMLLLWREFPADDELAMTVYAMALYLSALGGVITGGFLLYRFSWQGLFLSSLPIGLGAAALAAALLPAEPRAPRARSAPFDFAGLGLFTAWVVTMIPVVALGHYWGWMDSPDFVPWGVGFAVASAAFVAWGTLAARPAIDLRLLGVRNFGLGLAIKALLSIDFYVLASQLSGYMIGLRGYQWWQGALVFLPALLAMVTAMTAGALFGRDRDRKPRIFAGIAVMSAVTWHLASVDLYTSKLWIAAWLAAWGAGAGLAIGPTILAVFTGLEPQLLARSAGVFNIFRTLPVFAVGTLLGALLVAQQDTHFDRMRLRITRDRPVVAAARVGVERHLASRGTRPADGPLRAQAVLAAWVRANSGALALGDVLRTLALVTATSLLLVPLLRCTQDEAEVRAEGCSSRPGRELPALPYGGAGSVATTGVSSTLGSPARLAPR